VQNLHRRVVCSVWDPEESQKLSWPLSVRSAAPPGYSAPRVCCWETAHGLHIFKRFRNHHWSWSLLQSYQTADILHTDANYKYFAFTFHYTSIASKYVSDKSTSDWHQHLLYFKYPLLTTLNYYWRNKLFKGLTFRARASYPLGQHLNTSALSHGTSVLPSRTATASAV